MDALRREATDREAEYNVNMASKRQELELALAGRRPNISDDESEVGMHH